MTEYELQHNAWTKRKRKAREEEKGEAPEHARLITNDTSHEKQQKQQNNNNNNNNNREWTQFNTAKLSRPPTKTKNSDPMHLNTQVWHVKELWIETSMLSCEPTQPSQVFYLTTVSGLLECTM